MISLADSGRWFALLFAGALVAFWPSYLSRVSALNAYTHFHALTAALWMLLLVAQPIAIRTRMPQDPAQYVKKVYLVIDRNPSPVGAIFTFTPESGRADIETRVRIEEYTNVRAIAETSDGRLFMTTNYVKASGGCSAPAGKDLAESMARMGRMKFRVEGEVKQGEPALAQLMISHPNLSGMAMDQMTRLFTPAHFVRKIEVTYGGKPVMSAEVDFTISENPTVRFYFVPRGPGELKAEVVDSNQLKFESSIQVKPGTAGS